MFSRQIRNSQGNDKDLSQKLISNEESGKKITSLEKKGKLNYGFDGATKFYGVSSPCCLRCVPNKDGYCIHSVIPPCGICGRVFNIGEHKFFGFCHCVKCKKCMFNEIANTTESMDID